MGRARLLAVLHRGGGELHHTREKTIEEKNKFAIGERHVNPRAQRHIPSTLGQSFPLDPTQDTETLTAHTAEEQHDLLL